MTSYSVMIILLLSVISGTTYAENLSTLENLGKSIFFDNSLSNPVGQSCASCHAPEAGFADPRQNNPVSEGIVKGRFTQRSAPSVAYAGYAPNLYYDAKEDMYVGGYFADGRATTMEDQAIGPLLSAVEMNNSSKKMIVDKVSNAPYQQQFKQIYGDKIFNNIDQAYNAVSSALVAYQRSKELNPFSSKYDAYLAGKIKLSKQEKRGLDLFEDKGKCSDCHPSAKSNLGAAPLFTDFTYDNVGIAKNNKNPFYSQNKKFNQKGQAHIDLGLYETTRRQADKGKFKVPTLRNIALTAPYGHNGIFATLKEIIEFYNTRDVKQWGAPEVSDNVNTEELGDLKLTEQEVDDLEAFMETLTDGYSEKH